MRSYNALETLWGIYKCLKRVLWVRRSELVFAYVNSDYVFLLVYCNCIQHVNVYDGEPIFQWILLVDHLLLEQGCVLRHWLFCFLGVGCCLYSITFIPATASKIIVSKMLMFFLKATSRQNTCFSDNAACCVIEFFDSMVFDVVCITGFYKL